MLRFFLSFLFFAPLLAQAQEAKPAHIDTLVYNSGWIRVVSIQHIKLNRIYFTYTNSKEEEVEQSIGLNMLKFYRNRDTTGKLVRTKDLSLFNTNLNSFQLAITEFNTSDFVSISPNFKIIPLEGILEES